MRNGWLALLLFVSAVQHQFDETQFPLWSMRQVEEMEGIVSYSFSRNVTYRNLSRVGLEIEHYPSQRSIWIDHVPIADIRAYNGVTIAFSRGRGGGVHQLPEGLFIYWKDSLSLRSITSLVSALRDAFSVGSSFQESYYHHAFYYEPVTLCSSFFRSLHRIRVNTTIPFLSLSHFQMRILFIVL